MSATDTTASVSQDNGNFTGSTDDRGAVHEAAVAEIVGMIRAKYEDEGLRNFAIGKRAYQHAQWQRGNFPGYTGSDFDTLMNRIRDDVRLYVTIKASSIRVADWVRCHVLRELVRGSIADAADKLSMFEYLAIVGKALAFSKKDVEGSLAEGWLDFIKAVATDRTQGIRVTSEDFRDRTAAHEKALADAKAALDPAAAAAKAASDAIKAKSAAVSKANTAITSAVSEALAGQHITAEGVLAILENVAKTLSIPLPSAIGFDPARCTVADCDLLASTMFQAGKYAEMVHLRDKLDKMVSAVEKARAAATSAPSTRSVTPGPVKVAREMAASA